MRKVIVILVFLLLIRCSVTMVIGSSNRVDVAADKELDTGLDIEIKKEIDSLNRIE